VKAGDAAVLPVTPEHGAAVARPTGVVRAARWLERETFLVLVLAAYAVVLLGLLRRSLVSDSWLALVAGREIAENGVPGRDALTAWTAGREWVDQQWLAHLGTYAVYRAAGLGGLVLANAAAALAGLALALGGARRLGASPRSAALVAIACAIALLPFSAVRPQTFAYPLFVALFLLLEGSGQRVSRGTLLCLPILVVWANLHGSAILGAGLVSLWAATGYISLLRRGRGLHPSWLRFAGLAGAAWLCLLATPYTVSVVGYYRDILFSPAFRDVVTEWAPPSFPNQLPFFVLAAVAAALVVTPRPRYSLFARGTLVVTAGAGLTAVRHTAWLPLLVAVLAPAALDAVWRPGTGERHVRVNLALVAAAVAAVVAFGIIAVARPGSFYEQPLRPEAARVAAEEAARGRGPVLAASELADWLLWRQRSLRGRVAFDARFELLSEEELRRLSAFFRRSRPGWRSVASCCSVLVLRTKHETTPIMRREPGTRVAYGDATVTVLVRDGRR
jgi:hypothetical protein